ncbi:flagellar biosynthesis protein FlgN [Tropicimonas sp. IMCC34043]|uniref:flagellar biosynthesis protein FlgN n=1 Tax=Tropicimonas sp. IMCC34043 TaxID=2248760 RepID=UPI000E223A3F|nr:flagellar biosynthesis protein FlgN [Tropicimonas sp. IMCC34043]
MNGDMVKDLAALLERERTALIGGRLDDLGGLVAEKQEIIARLAPYADSAGLHGIRRLAHRNQLLLEAALRGVSAARLRLTEIRQAVRQFDTYTSEGEIRRVHSGGSRTERRA